MSHLKPSGLSKKFAGQTSEGGSQSDRGFQIHGPPVPTHPLHRGPSQVGTTEEVVSWIVKGRRMTDSDGTDEGDAGADRLDRKRDWHEGVPGGGWISSSGGSGTLRGVSQ